MFPGNVGLSSLPLASAKPDPPIADNVPSLFCPPVSSISRPQITDHPVFAEMLSLPGVSEDAAFRAIIVYLDLFEKKQWWNVDFAYNDCLSSILIIGRVTRNGESHVIIPVATETKLSVRILRQFLAKGAEALEAFRNEEPKQLEDSTSGSPLLEAHSKTTASFTTSPVSSMAIDNEWVAPTISPPGRIGFETTSTIGTRTSIDTKNNPSSPSKTQSPSSVTQSPPAKTRSPPSNTESPSCETPSSPSPARVTLGIVSRDATLVFYQISSGLLLPLRPLNAAQRLERDSLRKLGKKGEPRANEERRWVDDGANERRCGRNGTKTERDLLAEQNDSTMREVVEVVDSSDGGCLKDDDDVIGNDDAGGEIGGLVGCGGESVDWEEDTGGFWD